MRTAPDAALDAYSSRALARVWKAQRFSTWMTKTLHNFPADGPVGQRLQEAELDYLTHSEAAGAVARRKLRGAAVLARDRAIVSVITSPPLSHLNHTEK